MNDRRALLPVSPVRRRYILPFPAWIDNNPYLNSLYLVARARGYELKNSTRLAPFYDHLTTIGRGDVVHVHWTAPIVQQAPTRDEAVARLATFVRRIRKARRRGVRLLWTIHNRVPHDCPYPDLEVELGRFLAETADLVITINPATPSFVDDLYHLDPSTTVNLRHPSYQGLYAQSVSREDARATLGLEPTARAVLFFGQMRRYKGLGDFFDAMTELHRRDADTVMLLAGKTDDGDREWIDERLANSGVPVVRDHRFIPDDDVQNWFAAADTAVLPYERVLNSGSVFLCATFGRSVIAPRTPELLAEFGEQQWLRYYDNADPVAGLVEAVERALSEPERDSAAAREFAAGRPPYDLGLQFDAVLRRFE